MTNENNTQLKIQAELDKWDVWAKNQLALQDKSKEKRLTSFIEERNALQSELENHNNMSEADEFFKVSLAKRNTIIKQEEQLLAVIWGPSRFQAFLSELDKWRDWQRSQGEELGDESRESSFAKIWFEAYQEYLATDGVMENLGDNTLSNMVWERTFIILGNEKKLLDTRIIGGIDAYLSQWNEKHTSPNTDRRKELWRELEDLERDERSLQDERSRLREALHPDILRKTARDETVIDLEKALASYDMMRRIIEAVNGLTLSDTTKSSRSLQSVEWSEVRKQMLNVGYDKQEKKEQTDALEDAWHELKRLEKKLLNTSSDQHGNTTITSNYEALAFQLDNELALIQAQLDAILNSPKNSQVEKEVTERITQRQETLKARLELRILQIEGGEELREEQQQGALEEIWQKQRTRIEALIEDVEREQTKLLAEPSSPENDEPLRKVESERIAVNALPAQLWRKEWKWRLLQNRDTSENYTTTYNSAVNKSNGLIGIYERCVAAERRAEREEKARELIKQKDAIADLLPSVEDYPTQLTLMDKEFTKLEDSIHALYLHESAKEAENPVEFLREESHRLSAYSDLIQLESKDFDRYVKEEQRQLSEIKLHEQRLNALGKKMNKFVGNVEEKKANALNTLFDEINALLQAHKILSDSLQGRLANAGDYDRPFDRDNIADLLDQHRNQFEGFENTLRLTREAPTSEEHEISVMDSACNYLSKLQKLERRDRALRGSKSVDICIDELEHQYNQTNELMSVLEDNDDTLWTEKLDTQYETLSSLRDSFDAMYSQHTKLKRKI